MSERILVVDDDRAFQGMLVEALLEGGYVVETAASAEEGIEKSKKQNYDLILHDIKLPGMSGLEALPKLLTVSPGVDVIVMTGYASKDSGVQAMKLGAYDYFTKPFSLTEMEVVVRRCFEKRRLQRELDSLRRSLRGGTPLDNIIGQSPIMAQVKERIARVAELEADVLVTGETGTGKELISDTIHAMSNRASGPFIKLNCAAIPEALLESELFGHEKGAFTGATSAKQGKFEMAKHGSILLDEIGDMPLHLQPKLLRAVEQKQVERLGGSKPVDFDVRIIAATNQNLEDRVAEGKFRSDLFYRLNIATILLPPLRQRREDIPLLGEFFLNRTNRRLGTDIASISPEAMEIFYKYDWPGNVRQFANAVERAAIFCKGPVITAAEVDLAFSKTPQTDGAGEGLLVNPDLPLKDALQDFERSLILSALTKSGGIQTEAAGLLGVSPKNLWNKLQKHGIDPSGYKS